MLTGQYDVSNVHVEVRRAFTTTAPVSAYRGAGRPEACYVVERLVSAAARELATDPMSFWRQNAIPSEVRQIDLSCETASENNLSSLNFVEFYP